MFKIKWDEELNGISLTDKTKDNEEINSPRPVFNEELDLLGLNKYWDYHKSREPLLWAIGRRYYYRGIMVAEAKGGNIFESPAITLSDGWENLQLEPIDIKKVVKKNKKAMFVLENEAMDFVENIYKVHKENVDFFVVSFSGGKDSQVVLDIVSRVLHPEDFSVIFSDTTMEIAYTYKTVEKTKKEYQNRYSDLKFYTAKSHENALEFWKEFGPPSTFQRWCSTVTKIVPFVRFINDLYKDTDKNKQPKILVFEGVRAEESNKRSKYLRIRKNIKYLYQINAEVIQSWNLTEVYLYLFFRGLELNKGYRYGLDRVGCSVCPFASNWNESILSNIGNETVNQYISIIEEYAGLLGVKDNEKIKTYIAEGQWKTRAGGRGLENNGTMLDFSSNENQLKAVIKKPRENFLEWLKVAGDILYRENNDRITGELRIGREIFPFEIEIKGDKEVIQFDNIGRDIIAQNKAKKVLYKATYCVHCGACEVECPEGALKVIPQSEVKIDTKLCTHCSNCLNFVEKGCLAAKSVNVYGGTKMKGNKIATSKYQNFGMRRDWLLLFLRSTDDWFENENNTLVSQQLSF
ncbi:MAG: phosphoadenosine phosphosulfate reductase family protein [Halobacteriota archaeon]